MGGGVSIFGMSCSNKDAFQRAFPSGVTHDVSTYCEAFGILAKVSKLIFAKYQLLAKMVKSMIIVQAIVAQLMFGKLFGKL